MWKFAAFELAVCWVLWLAPFVQHLLRKSGRTHVERDVRSHSGFWYQFAAFCIVAVFHTARVSTWRILAAMALAPLGAFLAAWAVRHLGRQFAVYAGLYRDHELVRTGPYRLLRHPIYTSVLLMFLATAAFLAWWPALLVALPILILGTEIRVRGEELLLENRFGEVFRQYRRTTHAYLPLLR